MTRSILPIVLVAAVAGIGVSPDARAAPITYLGQTGVVSADGSWPTLGRSTDEIPISTLDDVDEVAFVEAGDPDAGPTDPYYRARAEMHTSLNPWRFEYAGDAEATANYDPSLSAFAASEASVTLQLALDAPTLVAVGWTETPATHNGPIVVFENLDLGLVFYLDQNGDVGGQSCGSLSFEECDALISYLRASDGVTFPAGEYVVDIELYAFETFGESCAVGCLSTGGTFSLQVIPEPSTGTLTALGLLGLGSLRSRARGLQARHS